MKWHKVSETPPPKDGTAVLFCCAEDADGQPIEPGTIREVFCQVASWWFNEGDEENGQWTVYCSMIRDPLLHFIPTHWAHIPTPVDRTADSAYDANLENGK